MNAQQRYQRSIRNHEQRVMEMGFETIAFTNKSLLDLGCNIGRMCLEAAARGCSRVRGVDCDAAIVGEAKLNTDVASCEQIAFHTCDITNEGLLGLIECIGVDKFDYVFAFSILRYVDPVKLIEAIAFYCRERCWLELNPRYARLPATEMTEYLASMLPADVTVALAGYTTDRRRRPIYTFDFSRMSHTNPQARFAAVPDRVKVGVGRKICNQHVELDQLFIDWRAGRKSVSESDIFFVPTQRLVGMCFRPETLALPTWQTVPELRRRLSGREKWAFLKQSLAQYGWDYTQPACVIIGPNGLRLANGHHRVQIAVQVGIENIPCCVLFE